MDRRQRRVRDTGEDGEACGLPHGRRRFHSNRAQQTRGGCYRVDESSRAALRSWVPPTRKNHWQELHSAGG